MVSSEVHVTTKIAVDAARKHTQVIKFTQFLARKINLRQKNPAALLSNLWNNNIVW